MRIGKTNDTQTNPPTPLIPDPGIIQDLFDTLSEFFEVTPVNKAVCFLNLVFCDYVFYEVEEENYLPEVTRAVPDRSIQDYKSEIKGLEYQLARTSQIAWESSRVIELIIEMNQTLVALSRAGMTSTAAKSIDARLNKSTAQ